jgi:tRNA modification GTPase
MGCEGPEYYVIHCHGNPLLAERIVRLCEDAGAVLRRTEDFLLTQMQAECVSLLEAEARLEMTRAATFEGVELIARQISGGLTAWATQWINDNSIDLNHLKKECLEIIERYDIAVRIIHGIKIALVGPPNSGKSTLLNWLAGIMRLWYRIRPGRHGTGSRRCVVSGRCGPRSLILPAWTEYWPKAVNLTGRHRNRH